MSGPGSGKARGRRGLLGSGPRTGEPQEIRSVLGDLRRHLTWNWGMQLGELARRWEEVVGAAVAAKSRPVSLSEGRLLVRARSAAWAAQLRFLHAEIRGRANAVLGTEAVVEVAIAVEWEGT